MWIFCESGFYSIVQHEDDPNTLIVRARIKGDLERLFPRAKVFDGYGSD
jgi:hypothetical protein